MIPTTGSHGQLSSAHADASDLEMARQYAQTILPEGAKWAGNVHVRQMAEVLEQDDIMLGVPKGADNLTSEELESYMKETGCTGGQWNLLDGLALPSSNDQLEQGKVGIYRVANVPHLG